MTATDISQHTEHGAAAGQSKRVLYYDVLNIAACLAVLFLHFNGIVHTFSPTRAWLQALVAECVFYWAVPIFFMLSGATLLRYRERYTTGVFLKKRFARTLIPFLAWSVIALVWMVLTGQMEPPVGPRSLINLVLNTQIITIYWFFIPLFALYLAIPVLSPLCDGTHDKVLWYGVAVAFVFNMVLPCLLPLVGIQYNGSLSSPVLSGYLAYPVVGYLLSRTELSKRQRIGIYIAGLLGLVLRYADTALLSLATGELHKTFWSYTYFPCALLSVAVFVFAKQVRWERLIRTSSQQRVLSKMASGSFGVYLMHMIFFWYALRATGLGMERLAWRTVMPFVCYAFCLAFTLVLKRIPVLKRIVP